VQKSRKYRKLKATRVYHGHTQGDSAKIIGISHGGYCLKERGKTDFTIPEGWLLAKAYGMSLEELFPYEDIFLPEEYEEIVRGGIKVKPIPDSKGKGFEVELPEG